jgi:hypothetical protein
MSDLDDALNTSTPMFNPVVINADWAELPEGYSVGGADSLRDLGQQVGPDGYVVSQSFDDGLPDPVTMTSTNDASGAMETDLVGRPENRAQIIGGFRAGTTTGSGSGTAITVTLPGDLAGQDYVIVAIMVNNQSGVYENVFGPGHPHGWELLAEASDGTGTIYTTYVFGRSHWTASPAPDFRIRISGSWSWVAGSVAASFTANTSSFVPVKPGKATSAVEAVSQTGHTGPYATLPSRGYLLGVFATGNGAGPWTVASGGTELAEAGGGLGAVQMIKSSLIDLDGDYRFVSNTNLATAVAMMINIPLVIGDRPRMDAVEYFSPFNAESPVVDFERDTAIVTSQVSVVSPGGSYEEQIFKGQMADIQLSGRTAKMVAVSKTRIDLDRAHTPPTIYGNRQGFSTDWLATWLLAHGGQYPGIAPSPQTRFWAPMHGSVQAHMDGPLGYSSGLYYTVERTPTGPYGQKPPQTLDGPFVTAMQGQMLDPRTEELIYSADRNWSYEVPGMVGEFNDLLSQSNSIGRMTFWIKGVAWDTSPDSLGAVDDMPFRMTVINVDAALAVKNFIQVQINRDRKPVVWLDSGTVLSGGDIPLDDQWHFCGIVWDYANGLAKFRRDNLTWNLSGFALSGNPLPATEAAWKAAGNWTLHQMRCKIPVAEIQLEAGPNLYTEAFTRFYPTPQAPSLNATYRPTRQWLEVLAEVTPIQGWSTLQKLAQSTLSHLRVNEEDNVEMVPLDYFGETEQMTVESYNVLSTDLNAADLTPVMLDPSKTRNLVTAEYQETRVDTSRVSILEIKNAIKIPRGVTDMTFALDIPTAEIHGAVDPWSSTWSVQELTALQIAGTNPLQNEHLVSFALNEDGTVAGTGSGSIVSNNLLMSARIMTWTSSTVTLRFVNITSGTRWVANNGQDIPFLRILGYPIRQTDGYTSARDTASVASRRERALTTQLDWVQTRDVATEWSNTAIVTLARPRPEIGVVVMGDPRRRPGQLVSLTDLESTKVSGTWRILKVDHKGNGPMYVQNLQLTYVGPVGVWDQSNWDEAVWGE